MGIFCMSYWPWYEHACKNLEYEHAHIFIEKYFKVLLHVILYNTILRKMWYGQVHWIDLLTKIPTKFILHFSKVSMNFECLNEFLRIFEQLSDFTK